MKLDQTNNSNICIVRKHIFPSSFLQIFSGNLNISVCEMQILLHLFCQTIHYC